METIDHTVVNMEGKEVGSCKLDLRVFGSKIYQDLVHQTVRWQRAKRRAGTHATLNRAKMEGGGRKPFKQKGSGRARAGSRNSPLWKGGAVIFGPQPRDYSFRLNKSARRQALSSVLTSKIKEAQLVIVDNLKIDSGKTKDMANVLNAVVGSAGKELKMNAVVLLSKEEFANTDNGVIRSTGNIPKVRTLSTEGVNVYDLVNHPVLVATKQSIEELQARVVKQASKGDAASDSAAA